MSIVKLSKPFTVDGQTYEEFNLDFESQSGALIRRAEKIARKHYGVEDMFLPMSDTYRMVLAALMLKIPYEKIETLPIRDYRAVSDDVLRFFGASALADMEDFETFQTPAMES